MAVIFNSIIEPNTVGGWQIRLLDTLSGDKVICNSIDEYAEHIERMGVNYGGEIEVKWTKDPLITPQHFYEIEAGMKKFQDDMENSK